MWMMLCAALVHSWVWRTMLGSTPGRVRNYFPASCRTRTPWHRCILWLWAPCSSGISNDASGFLRVIGRDSDDAGVLDDARFHAPPGFGERCLVQPQAERAANSCQNVNHDPNRAVGLTHAKLRGSPGLGERCSARPTAKRATGLVRGQTPAEWAEVSQWVAGRDPNGMVALADVELHAVAGFSEWCLGQTLAESVANSQWIAWREPDLAKEYNACIVHIEFLATALSPWLGEGVRCLVQAMSKHTVDFQQFARTEPDDKGVFADASGNLKTPSSVQQHLYFEDYLAELKEANEILQLENLHLRNVLETMDVSSSVMLSRSSGHRGGRFPSPNSNSGSNSRHNNHIMRILAISLHWYVSHFHYPFCSSSSLKVDGDILTRYPLFKGNVLSFVYRTLLIFASTSGNTLGSNLVDVTSKPKHMPIHQFEPR